MKVRVVEGSDTEEIVIYIKTITPLVKKVEECLRSLDETISFEIGGHLLTAPIASIECFYVENDILYMQYGGREYKLKRRLKDVEPRLNNLFFKINRSSIINLAYVSFLNVDRTGFINVQLNGGRLETVSRRRARQFRERINMGGFTWKL